MDEVRADESDVEILSGSLGFAGIIAVVGIVIVLGINLVVLIYSSFDDFFVVATFIE